MFACSGRPAEDGLDRPFGSYLATGPIGLTEQGLVAGAGSTLMRMRKNAAGVDELALDQDGDRLVALMSIAADRPVFADDLLPHVEAALGHWRRGDKALANFRLVFADLQKVSDQTSAYRLTLAEHLLESGWTPRDLMVELGFPVPRARIEKYNPNHGPAGHGRRSGQFDFRSGGGGTNSSASRIVVAQGGEDDKLFEERELLCETSPKEELEHGHPIAPTTGIPLVGTRGATSFDTTTLAQISAAARAAAEKVEPGKGPVYGTAVHTEFKKLIQQMGRDDLHPEQSYKNGEHVPYGTPGSIRVDLAVGRKKEPHTIVDVKTGRAVLTRPRDSQLRVHVPKGANVNIHEVRR